MTNISAAAENARESARRSSGEFGEQEHSAPELQLASSAPDLSTWEPADIDTAAGEIYTQIAKVRAPLDWREKDLERKRGDLARTDDGERYEGQRAYLQREVEEAEAAVTNITDRIAELRLQVVPYQDEYDARGGWTRAFLATTSANGHVHSSTSCPTCNRDGKPTAFEWMTAYSGLDEDVIVGDAGERACTVCYPSAPVDVLSRPTKMFSKDENRKAEEREQRDAAKREREAKKIENGLTADGSEFVVRTGPGDEPTWKNTERFKTERAAVTWATDRIMWHGHAGRNEHEDAAIQGIAEAISAKRGRPVGFVLGELRVKGDVKAKRVTASEGKKSIAALAEHFGVAL